jgi:hypothetical protein
MKKKQQFVWTDSDGVQKALSTMDDSYITNCLNFCKRQLEAKRPWLNASYYRRALKALEAEQVLRVKMRAEHKRLLGVAAGGEVTDQRLGKTVFVGTPQIRQRPYSLYRTIP